MRSTKFSWILHYFTKKSDIGSDLSDYGLTVKCDKAIVMAFRKELFWELHGFGLNASEVIITPIEHSPCVNLSVRLHCPQALQQQLNKMALRLSQLPNIQLVRWGRWKSGDTTPARHASLTAAHG